MELAIKNPECRDVIEVLFPLDAVHVRIFFDKAMPHIKRVRVKSIKTALEIDVINGLRPSEFKKLLYQQLADSPSTLCRVANHLF